MLASGQSCGNNKAYDALYSAAAKSDFLTESFSWRYKIVMSSVHGSLDKKTVLANDV